MIRLVCAVAVAIAALSACGSSSSQARPPGLQRDAALDVGCKLRGTPGYSSFEGAVTLYNPGPTNQSVSLIAVNWGANGVLLSQQSYSGNWNVLPHESTTLTTQAPASATSCDIAGWNP